MAKVLFTNEITSYKSNDKDWNFSEGYLDDIPNEAGVYIVGVATKISFPVSGSNSKNEDVKFCPLYIGQTKNLKKRIKGHRDSNNTSTGYGALNSFKELFDLSRLQNESEVVYNCIKIWDEEWVNNNQRNIEEIFNKIKLNGNGLIWSTEPSFFQIYLDDKKYNVNINIKSNWHKSSIEKRFTLNSFKGSRGKKVEELIQKIENVRSLIENKYYYYYWIKTDDFSLTDVEGWIKKYLIENYGLHTYSESKKVDIEGVNFEIVEGKVALLNLK